MSAIPTEKLDQLVRRWEIIQAELNQGASQASYVQLTREFAELDPVVGTIRNLKKAEGEVGEGKKAEGAKYGAAPSEKAEDKPAEDTPKADEKKAAH